MELPATSGSRLSGAALVLALAFTAIYLPAVGHGFVKDDFGWVAKSRLHGPGDVTKAFVTAPTGFYRPIVSLSFGVAAPVCGLAPRCYGIMNFLLALACAGAVYLLARGLSLSAAASLVASAIWIFNWHGINMATLWISGRTALLAVLFATLAAAAFVRGRVWAACLLMPIAMFAKEEAVLLPPILIAWLAIGKGAGEKKNAMRLVIFAAVSAVLVAVYLLLRQQSGAFTPATAPIYYRLEVTPQRVAANLPAYLDRSATFAAVIVALWFIVARPPPTDVRDASRTALAFAIVWWVGTLAVTVFLPVRSSLYACLPSVAAALAAAAVIDATAMKVRPGRVRAAVAAGLLLPFALWPIYAARNRNAVAEADLSAATIAALREVANRNGEDTVVRLLDDRSERPSLDNAFGTLVQDAADLMVQPHVIVWIDPPPADANQAGLIRPPRFDIELTLVKGRLVR
jgi:hypothetical protein